MYLHLPLQKYWNVQANLLEREGDFLSFQNKYFSAQIQTGRRTKTLSL